MAIPDTTSTNYFSRLSGTDGVDIFNVSSSHINYVINGFGGDDKINIDKGTHIIWPGTGNDIIEGTTDSISQTSWVAYSHSINEVESLSYDPLTKTVTIQGPEGVDKLININKIAFNDIQLSLNLDGNNNNNLGSIGNNSIDSTNNHYIVNGSNLYHYNHKVYLGGGGNDDLLGVTGLIIPGQGDDRVEIGGQATDSEILSGHGNNSIIGRGRDVVSYNFSKKEITVDYDPLSQITFITHANGTDSLKSIGSLKFYKIDDTGKRISDYFYEEVSLIDLLDANNLIPNFYTTNSDDTYTGTTGEEVVIFDIASTDVTSFFSENTYPYPYYKQYSFVSKSGYDVFQNVGGFKFTDRFIKLSELDIFDSNNPNDITTGNYNYSTNTLVGGRGNDSFIIKFEDFNTKGSMTIDGGAGDDLLAYNFTRRDVISVTQNSEGGIVIAHKYGTDTIYDVESFSFYFKDTDHVTHPEWFTNVLVETLSLEELLTQQNIVNNFVATNADDNFEGVSGAEIVIYDFASREVKGFSGSYVNGSIDIKIESPQTGVDRIKDIYAIQFTDKVILYTDVFKTFATVRTDLGAYYDENGLIIGGLADNSLIGEYDEDNQIYGNSGDDFINGVLGDNRLYGGEGNDIFQVYTNTYSKYYGHQLNSDRTYANLIDGGNGNDGVQYDFSRRDILSVQQNNDGSITVHHHYGRDTLKNIEYVEFDFVTASSSYFNHHEDESGKPITEKVTIDNLLTKSASIQYLYATNNDDIVIGKTGAETVILDFATSDVTSMKRVFGDEGGYLKPTITFKLFSNNGANSFSKVYNLQFTDKTVRFEDLFDTFAYVNTANREIIGSAEDDTLSGGHGNDTIKIYEGNDTVSANGGDDIIDNVTGNNVIDGGDGDDQLYYDFTWRDVVSAVKNNDGSTTITHLDGVDTISNVESLVFFLVYRDYYGIGEHDRILGHETTIDALVNGNLSYETFYATELNDDFVGTGIETVVFDMPTSDIIGINYDTIISKHGTDKIRHVYELQFSDKTITARDFGTALGHLNINQLYLEGNEKNNHLVGGIKGDTLIGKAGDDLLEGNGGDDWFYNSSGNNFINGGSGVDTVVYDFAKSKLLLLDKTDDGATHVIGPNIDDRLVDIETIQFRELDSKGALIFYETIDLSSKQPLIISLPKYIHAGLGEKVVGNSELDAVMLNFDANQIIQIARKIDNTVTIKTSTGSVTLEEINEIAFSENEIYNLSDFIAEKNSDKPIFKAVLNNNQVIDVTAEYYQGSVSFIEFQLFGNETGNISSGTDFNDFINLLGGDDAANGGAGRDVLDGGTGSNFLTGGEGADIFFLDGRGGTTTWSTITDFSDGDNVNIWGWQEGVSKLIQSVNNAGAEGYKGATFHYDLNNDGAIDTSITFSGLTTDQVPASSAQEVAGNGYLLFA